MRLLIFSAFLAFCAFACSSPESSGAAPAQVAFQDYRTGTQMVIRNAGDTDKVEFYSQQRSDAATKIATDEVMAALLDYLESSGLETQTVAGAAPQTADGASQSIEIDSDGRTRHVTARKGMPVDQGAVFKECVVAIRETYNAIYQLQAVQTKPGEEVFKTPQFQGSTGRRN